MMWWQYLIMALGIILGIGVMIGGAYYINKKEIKRDGK